MNLKKMLLFLIIFVLFLEMLFIIMFFRIKIEISGYWTSDVFSFLLQNPIFVIVIIVLVIALFIMYFAMQVK